MVTITFEECDGENFAHIASTTGVLGHAAEVKAQVPRGTWLTMDSESTRRLTPWMVKKCGFVHRATVMHEGKLVDILRKE